MTNKELLEKIASVIHEIATSSFPSDYVALNEELERHSIDVLVVARGIEEIISKTPEFDMEFKGILFDGDKPNGIDWDYHFSQMPKSPNTEE